MGVAHGIIVDTLIIIVVAHCSLSADLLPRRSIFLAQEAAGLLSPRDLRLGFLCLESFSCAAVARSHSTNFRCLLRGGLR